MDEKNKKNAKNGVKSCAESLRAWRIMPIFASGKFSRGESAADAVTARRPQRGKKPKPKKRRNIMLTTTMKTATRRAAGRQRITTGGGFYQTAFATAHCQ
ncbi:MAG: hypothetical protein IJ775_01545 [Muribaculaceae bacterium]|nr:hypothetical protein [Muribaculaceae bacterium]